MIPILFFFVGAVFIITWFIVYLITLFNIYNEKNKNVFENVLEQVKDENIFNQLVTGNSVDRIVIKGDIDINVLKKNVDDAQKKLDKLTEEINSQNLENKIENIKLESYALRTENRLLNLNLMQLQKQFDDIVHGTITVSSKSLFGNTFLFNQNSTRSKNKNLLHYLYKNIIDPFNIISYN